jgi:hypothetical protein
MWQTMADQLSIINSYSDHWIKVLEQDPVRRHIKYWERIASNREVFVINDGIMIYSVLCAAYLDNVPRNEDELLTIPTYYNVVCFYSIWSNKSGYGKKILDHTLNHLRCVRPYITRVVTLSPKTDMATKFHMGNGAKMFRENEDSINYEYPY